jgi:hypothetical protein
MWGGAASSKCGNQRSNHCPFSDGHTMRADGQARSLKRGQVEKKKSPGVPLESRQMLKEMENAE